MIEVAREVANIAAKHEGGDPEIDAAREHPSDIFDYFMNAENDSIKDALEEFSEFGFEEEDLRLMRIKFLSEYAN